MAIRTMRTLTALVALAAAATAAAAYPSKPIRLIVAGAAGSPPDAVARILAEPLAALGQPVLVENRPGALGTVALTAVVKAVPDGHTLGLFGLPQLVAPALMAEMPYDIARDLAAVSQLAWSANVLVVRPSSSARTLADLVALARQKPGMLMYSSAGNATPSHLSAELFRHRAGIVVQHVPFKGMPAALAAVMGEQVDFAFSGAATALPLIRSGKLLALATAGGKRLPALAELPTVAELGYAGYQLNEWYAIAAPSATPPKIVATLAAETARIIAAPGVQARLGNLGLYPSDKPGPEALAEIFRREIPRWKTLVREVGIRTE
jgi:tripartite-type tricarboxylate transporter receptor subunit TctC